MNSQESAQSITRENEELNLASEASEKQVGILEMMKFADQSGKIMMGLAAFFAFGAGGLIPVYSSYVGKANQFITELTNSSDIESIINATGLNFLYFGTAILIAMSISLVLFFLAG